MPGQGVWARTGQIPEAADTETQPGKEEASGMICSTGMTGKAPVLTLHSVLMFMICAG